MKKLFVTLAIASLFCSKALQAQTRQNIVIEKSVNGKTTKIEMRDGQMFLNGEKVDRSNTKKNRKALKELSKEFNMPDGAEVDVEFDMPLPESNKQPEREADADNKLDARMTPDGKPMLGLNTQLPADSNGAEIVQIVPGSAAAKAGLQKGDIIFRLGNMPVNNPEQLAEAVAQFKAGESVEINYDRAGKERKTIADLQDKNGVSGGNPFGNNNPFGFDFFGGADPFEGLQKMFGEGNRLGMHKPDYTNNVKVGMNVEERADGFGLRVADLTKEGIAHKAGLQVEDIITELDGVSISSLEDFGRVLAKANGKKELKCTVQRAKDIKTFILTLPVKLRNQDF